MHKWVKTTLIMVAIWLPILELASLVGLRVLTTKGLAIKQMNVTQEEYETYLRRRDPVLGWPAVDSVGKKNYDALGARVSPAYPDTQTQPCVSTYGDSFTYGDQVENAESYPNRLAARLGCRVNNFGVGGYGTDQALLRFRGRTEDKAPVAVIGHYPDDSLRNVNRDRGFLGGSYGIGLKPRLVLEGASSLRLLPILSPPDAQAYNTHFNRLPPENDYFAPGAGAGTVQVGFPHILGMVALVNSWKIRAKLEDSALPTYEQFYRPEHDSGALELTATILQSFHREAEARGQKPIILLLPDEADIKLVRAGRPSPYAPLGKLLRERGLEVLDLLGVMKEEEICEIYIACGQHYTPKGYDMVAAEVEKWIRQRNMLSEASETNSAQ